ncbi:MAG: histidine kinase dimerization/phospho-acceptor domain-containing protein [Actinomycetota bacterium]|nr:histidine kinase dimerization/phospho-acceptor domain-containing protein [Actinomycetota bacterium]
MGTLDISFDDIGEVVTAASLALAGASDEQLDAVVDEALGAIARHEHADRAYVVLYADDGTFSNSHEWVATQVEPHRHHIARLRQADFPWSVELARSGQVWQCAELHQLPAEAAPEQHTFGEFGVRSVLQVPMRDGPRTIGIVGFNHVGSSRSWPPATVNLVRRMGDAIGLALLRREVTRSLRAARDAAEQASGAKDRFLSHLNHELRTPLHVILGFAELLDEPTRSEADREAVHQILDSAHRLQLLLDELLAHTEDGGSGTQPVRPAVEPNAQPAIE